MRRFLKVVGGLVLSCIVLLYILANYSELNQEFECSGTMRIAANGSTEVIENASTLYMQLVEYRWWVHLWSDSDGRLTVVTRDSRIQTVIFNVEKINDGVLALYVFKDDKGERMIGGYRVANKELTLKIGGNMTFVGKTCTPR